MNPLPSPRVYDSSSWKSKSSKIWCTLGTDSGASTILSRCDLSPSSASWSRALLPRAARTASVADKDGQAPRLVYRGTCARTRMTGTRSVCPARPALPPRCSPRRVRRARLRPPPPSRPRPRRRRPPPRPRRRRRPPRASSNGWAWTSRAPSLARPTTLGHGASTLSFPATPASRFVPPPLPLPQDTAVLPLEPSGLCADTH